MDNSLFVNDKGRTSRCVANAGQSRKYHIIRSRDGFVQVTDQFDLDAFFLGPCFLRKRTVHTDGHDFSSERIIGLQTAREIAQFLGADAGEGEGEKQKNSRFNAEICGQRDISQSFGCF